MDERKIEEFLDDVKTSLTLLWKNTDDMRALLSALVRELQELNKTLQSPKKVTITIVPERKETRRSME